MSECPVLPSETETLIGFSDSADTVNGAKADDSDTFGQFGRYRESKKDGRYGCIKVKPWRP